MRQVTMYLIIRKFAGMRTVREAARRAESGIGHLMKQSPGFRGYYIFDAGNGIAGSVTLFDSKEAATAANEKALSWIRASLTDLIEGEPEVVAGEVLAAVIP
jgi:hypothetical protein